MASFILFRKLLSKVDLCFYRAIINHFKPKIDSWTNAHNATSLTEDQVCIIA